MADLGQAYVQIVPSAKGIAGKISSVLSGEVSSAGDKAGSGLGMAIAGKLKSVIAAAGIGAMITKAVKEGAALEQSYGGLDTIYEEAGAKAKKFAEQAAQMGVSANSYAEQAVSFGASLKQAFGGDTNKAVEAANTAITDMTDNAAKMGSPIESIQAAYQGFAKQNYTMLDNLKLGYGGTKSEMERLLTDASKLSGQKYDVSNLGDVYDAIHVIQGELNLTGTAAAEASGTLSGSFGAMKASAANLMAQLVTGGNFKTALTQLINSSTNFLFNNLVPALTRIIVALPQVVQGLISQGIPIICTKILELIPQLLNAITQIANQMAQWLNTTITNLANGEGLSAGGRKVIQNFARGLIQALPKIGIAMARLSLAMIGGVLKLPGIMLRCGGQIIGSLVSGIKAKLGSIGTAISAIASRIVSGVASLPGKLLAAGKRAISSFVSGLKSAVHMPKMHIAWSSESKGTGKKLISIPKPSISWYKTGGIFSAPSVIGVGEAGSEAVVPLDKFWSKLDAIATGQTSTGTLNLVLTLDGQIIGQSAVDYINGQTLQFNASPLAI